ncbi:MAG: VOC family protein [Clostridia bacterium]|nr:VOC family protein [Clostridia bacterium]
MKIGEVSLLTNDVKQMADFYKFLLGVDNRSDDAVHQFILSEETALTVFNGGTEKKLKNQMMCLAFTVEDIYAEYERLSAAGVKFIEKPTVRPWGAINMSFYDPDGNAVYMRQVKQ